MNERTRTRPVANVGGTARISNSEVVSVVPRQRGRLRVTADARPLPVRRTVPFLPPVRWTPLLVAVGSLPFVGAGGYVAGRLGADVIGQVLTAVGAAAAAAFLLSVLATVRHRAPGHHCRGCPDH